MKRKFISLLSYLLILIASACCLMSCGDEANASVDPEKMGVEFVYGEGEELLAAVITVENGNLEEGTTLADVMEALKDERTFTYTFSQGMLTEINGKKNEGSSYWLLYSDDNEMTNTEWGTYDYEGKTLASAIVGAEVLPVENDGIYVWAYQSF